MGENRKPLSLKEGHIYIDGVEVMDAVKLTIVYTPNVWSGKMLGDKGTNRRGLAEILPEALTSTALLQDGTISLNSMRTLESLRNLQFRASEPIRILISTR